MKTSVPWAQSLLHAQSCHHGRNGAICPRGPGGKVTAAGLAFLSFGSQLRVPGSLRRKETHGKVQSPAMQRQGNNLQSDRTDAL